MASSINDPAVRMYFIDMTLKRYVSEGTELVMTLEKNLERDVTFLHVNVIRKDGKMIQLQSDLSIDKNNWPRVSNELIAQLMMVG